MSVGSTPLCASDFAGAVFCCPSNLNINLRAFGNDTGNLFNDSEQDQAVWLVANLISNILRKFVATCAGLMAEIFIRHFDGGSGAPLHFLPKSGAGRSMGKISAWTPTDLQDCGLDDFGPVNSSHSSAELQAYGVVSRG